MNLNLPGTFMLWMKSRSVVPAHSAPSGAGVVSSKCTAFTDPVAMYAVEYAPQERRRADSEFRPQPGR